MFSFHRPKVYRSSTGCCICKAKSSSSRFTDSKKYEEDFLECFKLATPRQGEICNACVLLVKRWKKLPAGTERNWRHVVDARAGPGMKSFTKFKSKNRRIGAVGVEEKEKKKHRHHHHHHRHHAAFEREAREYSGESDGNDDVEFNEVDFLSEDGPSLSSSRTASPGNSDCEEPHHQRPEKSRTGGRRKKAFPKKREDQCNENDVDCGFVDLDYWEKEQVCCGTIYRGRAGETLVDPRLLKPCTARLALCKLAQVKPGASSPDDPSGSTPSAKPFCDTGSDSGYDESSNPGGMSPDQKDKAGVASFDKH